VGGFCVPKKFFKPYGVFTPARSVTADGGRFSYRMASAENPQTAAVKIA